MNIGNITSNNFNLDGNGKDMQIEVYEQLIEQLQQENKELKKQKEELRSWLEENIICYENSQNTNLGEYERKIHFYLYNDVLGKLEELEGVSNE